MSGQDQRPRPGVVNFANIHSPDTSRLHGAAYHRDPSITMNLMSERFAIQTALPPASTPLPAGAARRRTWLSMALLGLVASRHAQAQMGGGGGRGREGGSGPGATKCASTSAEPVSDTLVRIYAGERLQSLPTELQLNATQLPLFERYRQALESLMLDESRWAARAPVEAASPLLSLGAQIDLASNRAAVWEKVLTAVKPLYASMDKRQQAIADRRLVVSLEPSAWGMTSAKKGPSDSEKGDGPPAGGPPSR